MKCLIYNITVTSISVNHSKHDLSIPSVKSCRQVWSKCWLPLAAGCYFEPCLNKKIIPALTASWICSQICSVDLFSVVLTPLLGHACKYSRLSLNGHLCKTDALSWSLPFLTPFIFLTLYKMDTFVKRTPRVGPCLS